jgi:hypothetical protein
MNKNFLFTLTIGLVFSVAIINAYSNDAGQIIEQAKKASKDLRTVSLREKSITGSVNVTYSEGIRDYVKNEFIITEKDDATILRSIYLKNNVTYLYDGIFKEWVKFNEPVDFFAKPFNKDIWFSIFPSKPQELGLNIEFLGEEIIEGQSCYVVYSSVVDRENAKFYVSKFLGNFFPQSLIFILKSEPELLDSFLDTYLKSLEATLWISKKTFFLVKLSNSYYQMPGEGESILIKNESIFYDFNKPVKIELPPSAHHATQASTQDLGPAF